MPQVATRWNLAKDIRFLQTLSSLALVFALHVFKVCPQLVPHHTYMYLTDISVAHTTLLHGRD